MSTNYTTMTTKTFMLTGDSLIAFVDERMPLIDRGELTRTQMILDAGYVYDNGKAMYVDFYTELLRARGVVPVTDTDVNDDVYDNLSSDEKALFDAVDAKLGEKWSTEEVLEFIEQLDDIGIETAEQFEEAFEGIYDSEKEFAEQYTCDVLNAQIPEYVYNHIDWQSVFDCELRYDFNVIEYQYEHYFFRNN